jgi:hypothetical protein
VVLGVLALVAVVPAAAFAAVGLLGLMGWLASIAFDVAFPETFWGVLREHLYSAAGEDGVIAADGWDCLMTLLGEESGSNWDFAKLVISIMGREGLNRSVSLASLGGHSCEGFEDECAPAGLWWDFLTGSNGWTHDIHYPGIYGSQEGDNCWQPITDYAVVGRGLPDTWNTCGWWRLGVWYIDIPITDITRIRIEVNNEGTYGGGGIRFAVVQGGVHTQVFANDDNQQGIYQYAFDTNKAAVTRIVLSSHRTSFGGPVQQFHVRKLWLNGEGE